MGKRTADTTKRIALYLPFGGWKASHNDGGSKMLELSFVTVEGDQVNPQVRNVSDTDQVWADFDNLTFTTFARWMDYDGRPVWESPSMWETDFRSVYSVDRHDVERMTRMFKRLDRIKFPIPARTFGQYVALTLAGLKVTTVVTALSAGSWHNETRHKITDTRNVAELVDAMVEEFQFRVRPDMKPSCGCAGLAGGSGECGRCGRMVEIPAGAVEVAA